MRVAVLFGGNSSEREVSILSAVEVMSALKCLGHQALPVELTRGLLSDTEQNQILNFKLGSQAPKQQLPQRLSVASCLKEAKEIDKVFIALHGGEGENGTIQHEIEELGIPFTGSPSAPSALTMNKHLTKEVYLGQAIPTAHWQLLEDPEARTLDFPLIVKPNQEGSSVGVSLAVDEASFRVAFSQAKLFERFILVESYIKGAEYTVGVLGDQALSVGGIYPRHSGLFDYGAKYQDGATDEVFPPTDLDHDRQRELQGYALKAHQALGLKGYSRSDFMVDARGSVFTLETNTLPGLTKNSLLPKSARASGVRFERLIDLILRA
jgi:D-alanine-D-alanine ligase